MGKQTTKKLARDLHRRGLRTKTAKRAAKALTVARTTREPTDEARVLAAQLRALADELEHSTVGVVGEHAEPQRSARAAA
ncbi:hypothetical protein [Conexibacter sp. SYSU D00693]|uniref:hypothetical protein n=1 Tax=Conexibacter sp. SYSU D00693 TaxID=2812560 RepID=UPI00196B53BD|nr:hypothetical protein [Conexibacter sp. SYSU D00693]